MERYRAFPPLPDGDLWVFGYASLMWRPGFAYSEMHTAKLYGYHRALCVWSRVHRGTPECPGLVCGLDRGGSCVGRVFRVTADVKPSVVEYLSARELVTPAYVPRLHRVHWQKRIETALIFVSDPSHPQYAGKISAEEAADVVRRASGESGHNKDYVSETLAHLDELGIRDPELGLVMSLVIDKNSD